ncbi:MAG: SDR family NAD(P)-dependent oxidoreductase [Prochlorococcus marinus XMU1425]|nr:SDR family NAD(P)-dependent oxidoreductase [Prochlorococcus marinus XMU1425]MCR8534143.1 SDR family NAD(P)-dependent oxidoreductase [Prochlorococcus marinus XMU1426]
MKDKVLITGAAGFIGFHTAKKLISENYEVIGIDNLNNYYDVNLKNARLKEIKNTINNNKNWKFIKCDLNNNEKIKKIFKDFQPDLVINLAAQAGVRYSLKNPKSYIKSNIEGFGNILEACRENKVKSLIYASSSSVYGSNTKMPFKESDKVQTPLSLYGATKSANELMAHSYAHLYKFSCIGLRFFTVYGPWGRPDMAPMIFANLIKKNNPIEVFNYGKMKRDFTYISDIVEGIFRCCEKSIIRNENNEKETYFAPHKIFNIGNSKPIELERFIELLENELEIKAIKKYKPLQDGDVSETFSDSSELFKWTGFTPNTSLEKGIKLFVKWYKNYYQDIS